MSEIHDVYDTILILDFGSQVRVIDIVGISKTDALVF
jgi:hypothetical protein